MPEGKSNRAKVKTATDKIEAVKVIEPKGGKMPTSLQVERSQQKNNAALGEKEMSGIQMVKSIVSDLRGNEGLSK